MDSTQVCEPVFRIVSAKKCRLPGENIPKTAMRMLFTLLERLRLCHTPRIVSACCLTIDRSEA